MSYISKLSIAHIPLERLALLLAVTTHPLSFPSIEEHEPTSGIQQKFVSAVDSPGLARIILDNNEHGIAWASVFDNILETHFKLDEHPDQREQVLGDAKQVFKDLLPTRIQVAFEHGVNEVSTADVFDLYYHSIGSDILDEKNIVPEKILRGLIAYAERNPGDLNFVEQTILEKPELLPLVINSFNEIPQDLRKPLLDLAVKLGNAELQISKEKAA